MPRFDDPAWNGPTLIWKRPETWMAPLTAWLGPRLRPGGYEALGPGSERDLCWDDGEWLDVLDTALACDLEDVVADLADVLGRASLRTYHGTRTADAGAFFREGLKVHDREAMTQRVHDLVASHESLAALRGDRLSKAIAEIDNTTDDGRLYVVADDTCLLDHAAHYLINGSEWIMAVLGDEGRRFLRAHGTPTLLEIDLPLRMAHPGTLHAFAQALLQEWTRMTCNRPDWSAPIDFTFCLQVDIPASCIVGHTHPTDLRDPHARGATYRSNATTCALCAISSEPLDPGWRRASTVPNDEGPRDAALPLPIGQAAPATKPP